MVARSAEEELTTEHTVHIKATSERNLPRYTKVHQEVSQNIRLCVQPDELLANAGMHSIHITWMSTYTVMDSNHVVTKRRHSIGNTGQVRGIHAMHKVRSNSIEHGQRLSTLLHLVHDCSTHTARPKLYPYLISRWVVMLDKEAGGCPPLHALTLWHRAYHILEPVHGVLSRRHGSSDALEQLTRHVLPQLPSGYTVRQNCA